jgi:hypothetical protein
MTLGRPSGTPRATKVTDPPILHDPGGRSDDRRPGYCDSCKVPASSTDHGLLTFRLWSAVHGKWAGWWTLCEPCFLWRNRPEATFTDPLHVEEDAA